MIGDVLYSGAVVVDAPCEGDPEPTPEIVLASTDIDCDGVVHAWRRVTVPDYLATRLLDRLDACAAARKLRQSAQLDMLARLRAGDLASADVDAKRRDSHDADAIREARAAAELAAVVLDHCHATEQSVGGADWFPLSRGETARFLSDLAEQGDDHERDYWRTEGYHHQSCAR